MKSAKFYDTVTEAVKDLSIRGYTTDFATLTKEACLRFFDYKIALSPDEFQIDETYRFEGNTDPADETIVFAISSKKNNVKGILVNGYGIYADAQTAKIIELLI